MSGKLAVGQPIAGRRRPEGAHSAFGLQPQMAALTYVLDMIRGPLVAARVKGGDYKRDMQ